MGGIKRDSHQSVAFGEFDEVEGNSTLRALPCRWRAGTQRGLLPSGVITSLAGRPSPRTRNRHDPHTAERAKPLKSKISSERPCFTISLLMEPQLQSLCSEAALTTHKDSSFLGPSGPQLSIKMCRATAKPFSCFSTVFCKQESKLGAMVQPVQPHSSQLCASVPTAVCSFLCSSTFFFLGAMQPI